MAAALLNDILPLLKNVRRAGKGYIGRCPSHDDQKNSLSLSEGSNGRALLNCFAGCTFENIIAALDLPASSHGKQKRIEAIYDYTDESDELLYQNVKFEGKEFRARQFDQNGRETWNLYGVRRVPYRLAELLALPADLPFVMTEGEKDADTLKEKGIIATNHKNWRPEFNYLLKGKSVVIFQDHDKAGVEFAEKAAQMVRPDSKAVKIVDCFSDEPLTLKHGKDVSDYLEAHSYEELLELIRNVPDWEPVENAETASLSDQESLKVVCLSDVEAQDIVWLWKPFIPIGEFTIIEGIEGLGKSWVGCALACAVAEGRKLPFSDHKPIEPGNVLMLSAEDSLSHTIKPRLLSMRADLERIFAIDEVFSFSDFKDLIKFEAVIAEYQPSLVIIDPLFSYTGGKNLNQESESRPIARKIIEVAQKYNCAIIGVRHIGKSKGNGDARAAGMGSVAWRASSRSVLMVGKDEETGEKAICQTKNNLCEESKMAVGFEIKDDHFYWQAAPSYLTKEKMLAQPKDEETKAEQIEAVAFLREALRDGQRSSKEIDRDAREVGISTYALKKAKTVVGVESIKKGGNFGGEKGWFMQLKKSEAEESTAEEADSSNIRLLQSNQSSKASYSNNLAEDVEEPRNQHLQLVKPTSSVEKTETVRMKAKCRCGTEGFVSEPCPGCGEVLIPF